MKAFTDTAHCKSHAHCRTCRTDAVWRGKLGAPDACPEGFTKDRLPMRGLGDFVEAAVKPLAKMLKLPCLDDDGGLKATSGCAKRRDALNKIKIPKA